MEGSGARAGGAVRVDFDLRPVTIRTDDRTLLAQGDGDTVTIDQPVRMVSVDTPEKSRYAGSPAISQPKLDRCRERLRAGFFPDVPDAMAAYLVARLTPDAAQRHIAAAGRAGEELAAALTLRLALPGENGRRPRLAVMPTGAFLDEEARLLAYLAPWYAKAELPPRDDPRRETFNLHQIRTGWGAFFPISPSLPRDADMNMAIEAARTAWETPLGARAEFGEDLMPGYEFRMCIKLGGSPKEPDAKALTDAAFRRLCVDLRDMRMRGRFDWADVPEWARLWIWEEDREEAVARLGVVGA
jgi:endonuclease YncB( thermonuclease family)